MPYCYRTFVLIREFAAAKKLLEEPTYNMRRSRKERSQCASDITAGGVYTCVKLDIQTVSFIRGRILHGESYKAYRLITP